MESRPMLPGEIHLGRFPYGGRLGAKTRPVLLLTGPVGDVPEYLTAYVSSIIPSPLLASDLLIDPADSSGAAAGLKQLSVVRLHKLSTLHERDIFRHLGLLPAATMQEVQVRLRSLLNL